MKVPALEEQQNKNIYLSLSEYLHIYHQVAVNDALSL